jgi:hypothetical protein
MDMVIKAAQAIEEHPESAGGANGFGTMILATAYKKYITPAHNIAQVINERRWSCTCPL